MGSPLSAYGISGKTYSKQLGKWIRKELTKSFDYDNSNAESGAFLISFFRQYPDIYLDICRDKNAQYKLELPQRLMLRVMMRYRNTYITGVRGLTKTFIVISEAMVEGALYPGTKKRYVAPNMKQAARLATQAFHDIEQCYPMLADMWRINNDRADLFRITTVYGSEFTMYAPRGDTASGVIGEECGQENVDPFPIDTFISDVYPVVRRTRFINLKPDPIYVQYKHTHIGNACSRQNRAYTELRKNCLKSMLLDDNPYEGYVLDLSWITALLGNIRDITYFKDLKQTLSPEAWLRECCARYTGTGIDPLIPDEQLARAQKLKVMENRHCGDKECIYIVAHDVSYADSPINAKCADAVIKLTLFTNKNKRDKYRKQVVYVDSYPPPATTYLQAQKLKKLWLDFCNDEAQTTYLVIDAQAVGTDVVKELMKPTTDGTPVLSVYRHERFAEIEQPNALPIIYAIKATRNGGKDADCDMITYAQTEFTQGNVELLITNVLEGINAYKDYHNIKDDGADATIAVPYRKTLELCQQIANLQTVVGGTAIKEKRRSLAIQRDDWSALKYGLRLAQILEEELHATKYRAESSWSALINSFNGNLPPAQSMGVQNERSNLLGLRHR